MGKTGVECIQYEYLGVKGKKGKEDFFFHSSCCCISALV